MLAGTFGWIEDGKEREAGAGSLGQGTGGWIHEVSWSTNGIRVSDLRERRFLRSRGGWVLEGGLLRTVQVGDARVELYGKTITRQDPYANPLPHVYIGDKSWKLAHEFFLLHRAKLGDRASILRKWVVPDADGDDGSLLPRGFLEYDRGAMSVVVKVMNAHYAGLFVERVDLSNVLRR